MIKDIYSSFLLVICFATLLLSVFFVSKFVVCWTSLKEVRKSSIIQFNTIFDTTNSEAVFNCNIDMSESKNFFHNSYPRLVVGFKKSSMSSISHTKITIKMLVNNISTQVSDEKEYVGEFKRWENFKKDYDCFYPVGMMKLNAGLNNVTVKISPVNLTHADDLKVFLYFHETSNTGILFKYFFLSIVCGTMGISTMMYLLLRKYHKGAYFRKVDNLHK